MKDVTDRNSEFLQEWNLHDKQPNAKVLKKMVPTSLKGKGDDEEIPVYEASSNTKTQNL